MPDSDKPRIVIIITQWSLKNHPTAENPWPIEEKMAAIREAGFDGICCPPEANLRENLERYGLRYCGAFDADRPDQFEEKIKARLDLGSGPMNCQLADHDTPVEEAIGLTIELMRVSERLGAEVHLEVHRDTCTETPEKAAAIMHGYHRETGRYPLINFDFSHPAIVKHLSAQDYSTRLFEGNVEAFQQSRLWHMRPFNGQHCQVPVTDGKGNFSPEYRDIQPFVRDAFDLWLAGSRPGNEIWVVPELGPLGGYGLSCFPNIWEDAVILGHDFRRIWNESVAAL